MTESTPKLPPGAYHTAKINHFCPAGEVEVRIVDVRFSTVLKRKLALVESLNGRDIFTISAGMQGGYYFSSTKEVFVSHLRDVTIRDVDGEVIEYLGRPFSKAAPLTLVLPAELQAESV